MNAQTDGPMALSAPLLRLTTRQVLHARKTLFAALISLIPLLGGILMLVADITARYEGWQWNDGYTDMMTFMVLSGTVPLVSLLLSGGMIADDVEDRTLTYLLVRPVTRARLYLSKMVPVVVLAMVLAAFQAASLGLMRLLAYALVAPGARVDTTAQTTVHGGGLVLSLIPVAMGSAVLLAALLCVLFGFVSLIVPRYHFIANLLLFLSWELPFGHIGGGGFGVITATYYALSLVMQADPTTYSDSFGPAPWYFAVPWLLLWIGAWAAAGAYVTRRRDFNVTSAAT